MTHPPDDLPPDPGRFYAAGPEFDALAPPAPRADEPSALERLGPSPFPRTKFPFLGFLASVYDHVVAHARVRGDDGLTAHPPVETPPAA